MDVGLVSTSSAPIETELKKGDLSKSKNSPYDLHDPALYINRELSLLEFNQRVLDEAQDESNPLLERAKFLAIFSSNMDEFFMVRVAGLMQQVAAGITDVPADGMTPNEQLVAIRKKVRANLKVAHRCYRKIRSNLAEAGVYIHNYNNLAKSQQQGANEYFKNEIFPILTPLAFDPGRPFPHIMCKNTICIFSKIVRGRDNLTIPYDYCTDRDFADSGGFFRFRKRKLHKVFN
jgi:polyphosphate kinase